MTEPTPPCVRKQVALTTLKARQGMKPSTCDPAAGERVVFRDPVTGHTVWRMTDHPAIDRHEYYDIPAWNADGSLMIFFSWRAGERGYWLMNADGTGIRPMPEIITGQRLSRPAWSPTDPNLVYYAEAESTASRVMAMDVRDGGSHELVSVPFGAAAFDGCRLIEMPPPHPDGRTFLLRWGGQDAQPSVLVVVDSETKAHRVIDVGFPTHRVRFTKDPAHTIFVNSDMDPDDPARGKCRVEWLVALDGTRQRIPDPPGWHPDWSPDGTCLAGFTQQGIMTYEPGQPERRVFLRTDASGHGGFSVTTGRHHVADVDHRGPYADMCFVTDRATGEPELICYHGASYVGWEAGHPDAEATHPAPICSPDETKIVFDSDMLGDPDMWVAVWRRPRPPLNAAFKDGTLRWEPPELSREIAGYNVYRRTDSGWKSVRAMIRDTIAADLPDGVYAVSAQEWSGLESEYLTADTGELVVDSVAPCVPGMPRLVEAGPDAVILSLESIDADDVDHYNVYVSDTTSGVPSNATLVGSPRHERFVDWGLAPDTAYVYRVTAVDRHGNESGPSEPLRVRTEQAAKPVVHRIEVSAPGQGEPQAAVSFDAPADGCWNVWMRIQPGPTQQIEARLDGAAPLRWGMRAAALEAETSWWVQVPVLVNVPLKAGPHRLELEVLTGDGRITSVGITNDARTMFED